jgi:hypothetical protein
MRSMPGPGAEQRAVQLLGRERECAAIDRMLADAHGGISATLVLRGEAGIGKSALLGYARQQAASMTVLASAAWRPSPTWRSPGCMDCSAPS